MLKGLCLAVGMITITALAPATVIVFQGESVLATCGDNIAGPETLQYRRGFGWTPNVRTDFSAIHPVTFERLSDLHLWLGGGLYGDIYPGLWAESDRLAQTVLEADEGYTVRLHGWRMGGWPSTDRPMNFCKVLGTSFGVLWDSGATDLNQITVSGSGQDIVFDPPIEAPRIRIVWGTRSDIGGGNISFSQSPAGFASIVGHVELQDFSGAYDTEYVVVEVREPGTTNIVESTSANLDANGNFVWTTHIDTGTYDVAVKGRHWLRAVTTTVALTVENPAELSWSLINGDVDDDNEVTLVDFGLLSTSFGSIDGDPNWNSGADLDGDGEVTLVDYGILGAHFGEAGYE